jgi:hypothetical protein
VGVSQAEEVPPVLPSRWHLFIFALIAPASGVGTPSGLSVPTSHVSRQPVMDAVKDQVFPVLLLGCPGIKDKIYAAPVLLQ